MGKKHWLQEEFEEAAKEFPGLPHIVATFPISCREAAESGLPMEYEPSGENLVKSWELDRWDGERPWCTRHWLVRRHGNTWDKSEALETLAYLVGHAIDFLYELRDNGSIAKCEYVEWPMKFEVPYTLPDDMEDSNIIDAPQEWCLLLHTAPESRARRYAAGVGGLDELDAQYIENVFEASAAVVAALSDLWREPNEEARPDKRDRITAEDEQLLLQMHVDIKMNADRYREAGQWLDEYCSADNRLKRQKIELDFHLRPEWSTYVSWIAKYKRKPSLRYERVQELKRALGGNTESDDTTFSDYIKELFEHFLCRNRIIWSLSGHDAKSVSRVDDIILSSHDVRCICLVTWLITDPDADKLGLGLTEFDSIPWRSGQERQLEESRSWANYYWLNGHDFDEWLRLFRKAWAKLKAEKDLEVKRPAREEPLEEKLAVSQARHSIDFRSVHWFGNDYNFTPNQAAAVKILWEAWENGTPDVGGDTLAVAVDSDSKRAKDIFKGNPAFGSMICPGKTKGTYRLVEPGE